MPLIVPLDEAEPIVDDNGVMLPATARWAELVSKTGVIVGTGTPEGSVEAIVSQLYMDDSGSAGSILYIKKLPDIGGDKSQGWILV